MSIELKPINNNRNSPNENNLCPTEENLFINSNRKEVDKGIILNHKIDMNKESNPGNFPKGSFPGKPPESFPNPPPDVIPPSDFPPDGFPPGGFPPDGFPLDEVDLPDEPPDFPDGLPPPPKGKKPSGGPGGPPGFPPPSKNLMFEQKQISPMKLYCHLSGKYEVIIMLLGVIGSLGSGLSGPLMSLLMGGSITDFSQTQDYGTSSYKQELLSMEEFKETVDSSVKKFMYIGIAMFVVNFLGTAMWNYAGLLQIFHLKEKYFARILQQEQGWFDENNAYEFSTKVQAQLEQIELGLGEKFGQLLQMVSQVIAGFIIAFTSSWKLTLVMLCISPLILGCLIFLMGSMRKAIFLSMKNL